MHAIVGLLSSLGIAFLLSRRRGKPPWRILFVGLLLAVGLAWGLLSAPVLGPFAASSAAGLHSFVSISDAGANQVWGDLARSPTSTVQAREAAVSPEETSHPEGIQVDALVVSLPPKIIFLSVFIALLRRYGVIGFVIHVAARVAAKVFGPGLAGPEATAASANVFIGHTDVPLLLRSALGRLSRSQLLLMMAAGFATVSVVMLPVYSGLLGPTGIDQDRVMQHLLVSCVVSAVFVVVLAKIACPPEGEAAPSFDSSLAAPASDRQKGFIETMVDGAFDGFRLAVAIGVLLVAFIAVGQVLTPLSEGLHLSSLLVPIPWMCGMDWEQAKAFAPLLVDQALLTELVAFSNLADLGQTGSLDPRAVLIALHMLCGFASLPSIAVQVGALQALCPERKSEFYALAPRAVLLGFLACWSTASIVSLVMPYTVSS